MSSNSRGLNRWPGLVDFTNWVLITLSQSLSSITTFTNGISEPLIIVLIIVSNMSMRSWSMFCISLSNGKSSIFGVFTSPVIDHGSVISRGKFSFSRDAFFFNSLRRILMYFEIEDDMLDGVRGNSASPIRYDDRTTTWDSLH